MFWAFLAASAFVCAADSAPPAAMAPPRRAAPPPIAAAAKKLISIAQFSECSPVDMGSLHLALPVRSPLHPDPACPCGERLNRPHLSWRRPPVWFLAGTL